jgi:hypothetical protein
VLRLGSVYTDPYRLIDPFQRFWFRGRRNRQPAAEAALKPIQSGQSQAGPERDRQGQPPQFSPEQICLDVGRIQAPARLAWAIVFRASL